MSGASVARPQHSLKADCSCRYQYFSNSIARDTLSDALNKVHLSKLAKSRRLTPDRTRNSPVSIGRQAAIGTSCKHSQSRLAWFLSTFFKWNCCKYSARCPQQSSFFEFGEIKSIDIQLGQKQSGFDRPASGAKDENILKAVYPCCHQYFSNSIAWDNLCDFLNKVHFFKLAKSDQLISHRARNIPISQQATLYTTSCKHFQSRLAWFLSTFFKWNCCKYSARCPQQSSFFKIGQIGSTDIQSGLKQSGFDRPASGAKDENILKADGLCCYQYFSNSIAWNTLPDALNKVHFSKLAKSDRLIINRSRNSPVSIDRALALRATSLGRARHLSSIPSPRCNWLIH